MKKTVLFFFLFSCLHSCIPLRVAPQIEDYRLTKGNKFEKKLPQREMFVFEDPKDINHFYHYVNIKYQLNSENVYDDIPFKITGKQYFFSFYEVELRNKTFNLGGILFDAAVMGLGGTPMLYEDYSSKNGKWYIAIEVYSDLEKDCLKANSFSRELVLKYLRALKKEYLSTHNYNETVFKN